MMEAKRVTTLSMLMAIGSVLYLLESLIPFPLPIPGGRWGFSNLVLIIALAGLPFGDILALSIGKSIIGSLLAGRLATPGFLMGVAGAVSSAATMWLMNKTGKFGLFGISIAGAAVSNFSQLMVASSLIIKNIEIIFLYPYMLVLGSISASINAYVAFEVIRRMGDSLWQD
ncbi:MULTISPECIES: Gx transporter family protein [unclassified Mesotoga]|uniref:Gx transporter family protein n=1 Tax=unclassified Mesotoga TaxID=1184398 RepID=UPI00211EDF64|nr:MULTISPECIES: Gx transporter family protein [unclassified Mesotoga]